MGVPSFDKNRFFLRVLYTNIDLPALIGFKGNTIVIQMQICNTFLNLHQICLHHFST